MPSKPASRPWFSDVEVEAVTLVRALGICLIAVNHSFYVNLQGGFNILVFLAGLAFARVAFRGDTRATLHAIPPFLGRLVVFSVVLMAVALPFGAPFNAAHFLFAANLFGAGYPKELFSHWYVQALLQMLVLVGIIVALFDLTPKFRRHPRAFSLLFLLIGIIAAMLGDQLRGDISRSSPEGMFWGFALGWLFWASIEAGTPRLWDRLLLAAACIAAMVAVFVALDDPNAPSRLLFFAVATLPLIFVRRTRLPRLLAHPIQLASQATMFIFFLHKPSRDLGAAFASALGYGPNSNVYVIAAVGSAVLLPILAWALFSAVERSWGRRRALQIAAVPAPGY